MVLRLFHIEDGSCKNIMDLMHGVKLAYEMESEFIPYLDVNFLPKRDGVPGGVILQTKKRTIRKNYDFTEKSIKQDKEDLRKMIWQSYGTTKPLP